MTYEEWCNSTDIESLLLEQEKLQARHMRHEARERTTMREQAKINEVNRKLGWIDESLAKRRETTDYFKNKYQITHNID